MAMSAQKTVAAAGTAEALGTQYINGPLAVKALDTNGGKIYIGNDGAGDVASTNGLVLLSGEVIIFDYVGNLGSILIDSSVNGEGVAWLALNA